MKRFNNFIRRFWKDESAQGMTEYILLLVIVVGLVVLFKDRIQNIIQGKIGELGEKLNQVK